MCVSVYVSFNACPYTSMCVCTNVCMYVCMYVCIYVYRNVCVCTNICMYMYIYTYVLRAYICMYVYINVCTYVYMYMCIWYVCTVRTFVRACVRVLAVYCVRFYSPVLSRISLNIY
jgi:hypothetical protein